MLFWITGLLSIILGFCVAIHVVFEKFDKKLTVFSFFITAALGTIVSAVTGLIMMTLIWPPITFASWFLFAIFASIVLLILSTGKKEEKQIVHSFQPVEHSTHMQQSRIRE